MSSPDTLQSDLEQNLSFGHHQPEALLDFDGAVERLAVGAAMLGPIATMFTFERPPRAPVFVEGPAAAADVVNSTEFAPSYEAPVPTWREGAEAHLAGASIMFASERADYELAA